MRGGPRSARRGRREDRQSRRERGPLTQGGKARALLGAETRLATVVRPTGDPAGTVATRCAGLVEFSATLSYRRAEEVPEGPTLPALPAGARCSVLEADAEVRREILGEILALSEGDLGSALGTVLRSLAIAAALSDAVLQTRAARVAPVRPSPAGAVQALARDLRDAGFPVRFAPTWKPLAEGEIGLGISGAEEELRRFLGAHPSWELPAPTPRKDGR